MDRGGEGQHARRVVFRGKVNGRLANTNELVMVPGVHPGLS